MFLMPRTPQAPTARPAEVTYCLKAEGAAGARSKVDRASTHVSIPRTPQAPQERLAEAANVVDLEDAAVTRIEDGQACKSP